MGILRDGAEAANKFDTSWCLWVFESFTDLWVRRLIHFVPFRRMLLAIG